MLRYVCDLVFLHILPFIPAWLVCVLWQSPESRQLKEAELDQICRAIRVHFQARRRKAGDKQANGTTTATSTKGGEESTTTQAGGAEWSTAPREKSPQDRLSVMLSRVFPGRLRVGAAHGSPVLTTDMIQRLAEELGLEESLVTERLKATLHDMMEFRKTPTSSTAVR